MQEQENRNQKSNNDGIIRARFAVKPDDSVLDQFRQNGWKWERGYWKKRNTPENMAFAHSLGQDVIIES